MKLCDKSGTITKKLLKKEKENMVLKSVESQNIEFKSAWRDEYLKAICSFANADGGRLIIGVDDRSKPVGVRNAGKLLKDIPNKVRNKLGIIPSVEIESKKGKKGAKAA